MRDNTCKLIALAEEGAVSWESIARECLAYMSEDDVSNMIVFSDLFEEEEEEEESPEEGDYIIECTGSKIIISKYNDSPPWRHIVKDGDDIKKIISDEMEREKFWPNIWNLSDHGNLSLTTLEEIE